MPVTQLHEVIDLQIFGEAYPEVHSWIDGTFNGTNGRVHWVNRHHNSAILAHFNSKDFPAIQYRERLIQVARMHILMDWMFYYKRIILPLTRQDVIDELLSEGVIVV